MSKNELPKILSWGDLCKLDKERERRMNKVFTYKKSNNTMLIGVQYSYQVDLDRIKSERDLLAWVLHLSEKTWMTTDLVCEFAKRVAKIKGLNIYGC